MSLGAYARAEESQDEERSEDSDQEGDGVPTLILSPPPGTKAKTQPASGASSGKKNKALAAPASADAHKKAKQPKKAPAAQSGASTTAKSSLGDSLSRLGSQGKPPSASAASSSGTKKGAAAPVSADALKRAPAAQGPPKQAPAPAGKAPKPRTAVPMGGTSSASQASMERPGGPQWLGLTEEDVAVLIPPSGFDVSSFEGLPNGVWTQVEKNKRDRSGPNGPLGFNVTLQGVRALWPFLASEVETSYPPDMFPRAVFPEELLGHKAFQMGLMLMAKAKLRTGGKRSSLDGLMEMLGVMGFKETDILDHLRSVACHLGQDDPQLQHYTGFYVLALAAARAATIIDSARDVEASWAEEAMQHAIFKWWTAPTDTGRQPEAVLTVADLMARLQSIPPPPSREGRRASGARPGCLLSTWRTSFATERHPVVKARPLRPTLEARHPPATGRQCWARPGRTGPPQGLPPHSPSPSLRRPRTRPRPPRTSSS